MIKIYYYEPHEGESVYEFFNDLEKTKVKIYINVRKKEILDIMVFTHELDLVRTGKEIDIIDFLLLFNINLNVVKNCLNNKIEHNKKFNLREKYYSAIEELIEFLEGVMVS